MITRHGYNPILAEELALGWMAVRLRLVMLGRIFPDENEPFDLLLLWAMRLK